MRCPFDATGTIGSMACEKTLNRILAERVESGAIEHGVIGKLLKTFAAYRTRLKHLEKIEDNATYSHVRALLRHEAVAKVTGIASATGDKDIVSHSLCCLNAYFSKSMRQLTPPRQDGKVKG